MFYVSVVEQLCVPRSGRRKWRAAALEFSQGRRHANVIGSYARSGDASVAAPVGVLPWFCQIVCVTAMVYTATEMRAAAVTVEKGGQVGFIARGQTETCGPGGMLSAVCCVGVRQKWQQLARDTSNRRQRVHALEERRRR